MARLRTDRKLRAWAVAIILMLAGAGVGILIAEWLSRWVMPVSPGARLLNLDGTPFTGGRLTPGSVYRQVSSEYDAMTHITTEGHRAPSPGGCPEEVFVGDSFTFGTGLSDTQTFAFLYGIRSGRLCANLGVPGAGTEEEVDVLERFLSEHRWRPRRVRLFMMAMTGSLLAGNDLADNLNVVAGKVTGHCSQTVLQSIADRRNALFARSNLLRVTMFYWGPWLRNIGSPSATTEDLTRSLAATSNHLARIDRLSRQYSFEWEVTIIHPVQDILRGTHGETLVAIRSICPVAVRSTAQLFEDRPTDCYYPYDGHLNSYGSCRIAEDLLSRPVSPQPVQQGAVSIGNRR